MSTIESQDGLLSRQSLKPGTVLNSSHPTQLDYAESAAIIDSQQLNSRKNSQLSYLPSISQVSAKLAQPSFGDILSRKASNATVRAPTSNTTVRAPTQGSFFKDINSRKSSLASVEPTSVESRIAHDLLELLRTTGASRQSVQRSLTHLSQTNQISAALLSEIEAAILRSSEPVVINETDEIEVLGQRGIWANKAEVLNWKGDLPINEYLINEDANPEVITKRSQQILEYLQEIAIRYLRPPTPPAPGEIVITQEQNILTPPAPPLVIRQQPARPETPEPLVIREAPPQPPAAVGRKLITISGKRLPPAPRKVVIERFAELPAKPQSVLIERWLPYSEVKRRVLFQAAPPDPIVVKPRNTIVQWEAPQVQVRKEFKYLGVVKANPAEYVNTYGLSLRISNDLPNFVNEIRQPDGLVLAADYKPSAIHELEGDLHALKLIDLEQEGLGDYKQYLIRLGVLENAAYQVISTSGSFGSGSPTVSASVSAAADNALEEIVENIFRTIDRNNNGIINVEDAEKTLLRLNSRLGRRYGEDDVRAFFNALDVNNDGTLDLNEFKRAFLNIAA